jgi:flavin reductase (DIM6/NTAB) family NADH-FMN oxidoreductase RutF
MDTQGFRDLMSRLPRGVTILSVSAGETTHGMTASDVIGLSLEPLLFLVSVAKSARAHDVFEAGATHFVVNFLALDQAKASDIFADKVLSDEERWSSVTTHPSTVGPPRIDGCIGWFDCRITDRLPGGDHTIYLGEVVDVALGEDKPPLVHYRRSYRAIAPAEA